MTAGPGGVVVTGIGMRTAVGNHAAQSCASIRAGINRFAEWPHFGATLDDEGTALIASATRPDLGDGAWMSKALELAMPPLQEAAWQAGLVDFGAVVQELGGYRAAGFLALPYADRVGTDPDALRAFAIDAREHCMAPFHADRLELVGADQAAGLALLGTVVRELEAGQIDVAVLGGLDSFLHSAFLGWLHDVGRLKVPTTPAGLIPGEAAAFVILEREAEARRRGARPLARIASVAVDGEAAESGSRAPERPDATTRALRGALDGAGGPGGIDRVIVDLNGERWRFLEWALVETRCLGGLPYGWRLWHPADCIGDVGAAFAPAAIGIAVRALERGYAGRGGFLICCASERGERAAACLLPVENGVR